MTREHWSIGAGLAIVLSVMVQNGSVVAFADADQTEMASFNGAQTGDTSPTDPPGPVPVAPQPVAGPLDGGPSLVCTGRPLPIQQVGSEGMAVTCTVQGAAADETSFTLNATLVGATGESQAINPLCGGELSEGAGLCSRNVIAPIAVWGGSITVSGTLGPCGRALGSVSVTSTP